MFSVGPVQDKEVSIARRLRHQLSLLAIELAVKKYRSLHSIPIVRVMWRGLEIPRQLAGIGIYRDNRFGVQIVSATAFAGHHRLRIPGAEVIKVQRRIVRA